MDGHTLLLVTVDDLKVSVSIDVTSLWMQDSEVLYFSIQCLYFCDVNFYSVLISERRSLDWGGKKKARIVQLSA